MIHLRRAAVTAGVALLALGPLVGCGLFDSGDDAAGTSTSASTSTTAAPLPPADPPTVLDAGAEPRQELRLRFTEGQTATISVTSDLQIDQEVEGRPQRLDAPPITQVLEFVVGAVTGDGAQVTARIAAVTVDAEGTGVTDAAAEQLEADLSAMVGLTGTGLVTPFGAYDDLVFDVPDAVDEGVADQVRALQDQVAQLGPTLPIEAVGEGANWTYDRTQRTNGVVLETTTTVTLASVTATSLTYSSTSTGTADDQPLTLADLPDGTTAHLVSSAIEGTSTGTLALDRPEFTWETQASGPQEITLTSPDATIELTQQIHLASAARSAAN